MPNPSMQKRITTQLLMQDIFAQVRSIYRYIYWSPLGVVSCIEQSSTDSQIPMIFCCVSAGEWARVKCLLWFRLTCPRHTVTRDTAWPRDTSSPLHRSSGGLAVVTIISSQSGPGPGHSPRTPLLPPWSVDISHVHYLKIVKIFISLWNALYLIKLNIGMLLVKVRPSLPSARKVEQRGGATWPGCCCWPEWPGNFLSCLAFICSQHQHSTAGHSAQ